MDSDLTLGAILVLAIVMYAMGFRLIKNGAPRESDDPAPQPPQPVDDKSPYEKGLERQRILLDALDQRPFTQVITPAQREELRASLLGTSRPADVAAEQAPPDESAPVASFSAPSVPVGDFAASYSERVTELNASEPSTPAVWVNKPAEPGKSRRESVVESIRSSWDPAVMMLYLGALLVVIAGLIFATYNWGSLGAWQKLGMLAAATVAFLVAGFVVRRVERLEPAATTFITVGGLLVPANFLAAYTVFDDVQPALPLLFGAIATTVVHALLSYQPNSSLFRYTSVGAAMIAIASVPAAIGLAAGWGGVLGLAVIALMPDNMSRLNRFRKAWWEVGRVAASLLAGFALWRAWDVDGWILAATLIAFSMVVRRFVWRNPTLWPGIIVADLALVVASMQIAVNFDGERWMIAAGLMAATLLLLRESRYFKHEARGFELVAAFTAAALASDVTRVLAPDAWTIAAGAAALTLLLLVIARRHVSLALMAESIATYSAAIAAGEFVRNTADWKWGVAAFAATFAITLMIHARRWPSYASLTEGLAAFAAPFAIGATIVAINDSAWSVPIALGAFTLTLILYGIRNREFGDLPYAAASLVGIVAIFRSAILWGVWDDDAQLAALCVVLGLAITGLANAILPRITSTQGWLRSVLRIETLPIFLLALLATDFANVPVLALIAAAMFWNLWVTTNAVWSLPIAGLIVTGWTSVLMPNNPTDGELIWWVVGLGVVMTAFAWQLDRRTEPNDDLAVPAGFYAWLVMGAISLAAFAFSWQESLNDDVGLNFGLAMLVQAALFVVAYYSAKQPLALFASAAFALFANVVLIVGDISSVQHAVIGVVLLGLAVIVYRVANSARTWAGFAAGVAGLIHILLATELAYSREILLVLAAAWVLVSVGVLRWRTETDRTSGTMLFLQAAILHAIAWFLPALTSEKGALSQSDLVIVLISLAGTVATYGGLRRSREIVLAGSGIGMSALMLQVNLGEPGNLHVYTVPMAVYLIAVGLLLRRDARVANVLLAAGSGMLVIPAMLEALTTGSINWLWIALAEAIALFLFGTVLRLRIPTAAGVIAVSVIALRMLVFAVDALASWVSILAIGVVLLLIGTLWLIFRDAITAQTHRLLSRWRAYD